ncbi:MAG: hypothetical protein K0S32_3592 [Bacteroidetes bacterium]|jgi:hypothetical protein|nr:hypothetical protein [Bacteroidota bacterium]
MRKTNEHYNGVKKVIRRARTYNNDIGRYKAHYEVEDNTYYVEVSTGALLIPKEVAMSQEIVEIWPQPSVIFEISKTFKTYEALSEKPIEARAETKINLLIFVKQQLSRILSF